MYVESLQFQNPATATLYARLFCLWEQHKTFLISGIKMDDSNANRALSSRDSRRKLMLCVVRTPNHGCQICRAFVQSVKEGVRKENPELEERFARHQRRLADRWALVYSWYYLYVGDDGKEKLEKRTGQDYVPYLYDITKYKKRRSCCGVYEEAPPCRFCP